MTRMIFKKLSVPVLCLISSAVVVFSAAGLRVYAQNEVTIPNVSQTTQAPDEGQVTEAQTTLPYDVTVNDTDKEAQNILMPLT